jgi:hypothetical protein
MFLSSHWFGARGGWGMYVAAGLKITCMLACLLALLTELSSKVGLCCSHAELLSGCWPPAAVTATNLSTPHCKHCDRCIPMPCACRLWALVVLGQPLWCCQLLWCFQLKSSAVAAAAARLRCSCLARVTPATACCAQSFGTGMTCHLPAAAAAAAGLL